MTSSLKNTIRQIRRCRLCEPHLPLGARPVMQAGPQARILIAAQAPGRKVHESGRPFTDASGERLRAWLEVSEEEFYDEQCIAIVPMGFCYPGRGNGGDLPPRPECAPAWRARVLAGLPNVQLTLVIGRYAMAWHLPGARGGVTDVVRRWRDFWPAVVPLPHPSPRNNLWLRRNPWFESELIPQLQRRVSAILRTTH
ncbi:MAG: uracil-DNA glycosylase family protein [Steroidobacteraceae bacterium]